MKNQPLLAGICVACSLLPVVQVDATVVERQRQGTRLLAQQGGVNRAIQLVEEGDGLSSKGNGDALLQAIELYQEALYILNDLDMHREKVSVLARLGESNFLIGRREQALTYFEQTLVVTREVGNRAGEAIALNGIGSVYDSIGEKDRAIDFYEQTLSIHREVGDRVGEAVSLNNIGLVHDSTGEKDKALEFYRQALPIHREIENRGGEATTLTNIGLVYDSRGEKDRALEFYNQALPIHREVRNRRGEAATLNSIGRVHDSRGEKDRALEFYNQALPIQIEVRDRAGEANTRNNIGSVYDSIGEKDKALEFYNQALLISREVGNKTVEAIALDNIGLVYHSLGETDRALYYYIEQALPIRIEIRDRAGEANTRNNIGAVHNLIGEKDKALDSYEQALAIYKEVGNRAGEATTLNNIGSMYDSIGDTDKALDYYKQALPIRIEVGDRAGEAASLNNIGLVYDSIGDTDKALDYYEQALPIQIEVGNRAGEATTLSNIGLAYAQRGDTDKALDYYEQALPIQIEVGNRAGEATTLSNIGLAYAQRGDTDKALDYYEQALPIQIEVRDTTSEATTLYSIAFLSRSKGNLQQALENISNAVALVEDIRNSIGADDLRANYFSTVQDYYELKVDILMQLGQPEAAFETSEAARARVLVELLSEANVDIREGVPTELLAEESNLRRELLILDQKYIALRSQDHEDEDVQALNQQSDNLLQQLDGTLSKIRRVSPAYAATVQPQPLSLQQIQQQVLDADTVLLQYSLGEAQSYLWIVGADSFQSYEIPSRSEVEAVANQFRSATTTNSPTSDVNRKGKELAALILPNLPEWTDGKRLVISGDGVLSELAFGAIPLPGSEPYTPLLVNHEILTQSSISSIDTLRQQFADRTALPTSIALLADPVYQAQDNRVNGNQIEGALAPTTERNMRDLDLRAINRLPYTRTEADAILKTANNLETLAAFDFDANYDWATDPILSEYSIVHMATHGFINPVNPQLSGVVLNLVTPDGELTNNGFLRLHDIFNLKLDAELVVLSACQTGLGENIGGEGIVGLSRGFMYAGAERVMVSLWNVNDESTATLMSTFYRYLLEEDMTPAAALRAAQKVQWEAGEIPYKWAAFTLQGEWQ